MDDLWQVSLQVKIGAVLLVVTTNANRFVYDAGCGSFAWALTMHLSRCRVLKFNMAINTFNPTLFDLSHNSPHAELKGVTGQATFVHSLLINQCFNSVGVTSVEPLLILSLMASAAELWRQVMSLGSNLHQLLHLPLQFLLPLLVVFVNDFLDLRVIVPTSRINPLTFNSVTISALGVSPDHQRKDR